MKRNYSTPNVLICALDEKEIFTNTSGEVELVSPDDWYE